MNFAAKLVLVTSTGVLLLLAAAGCRDMANQPKLQPLEANSFFANGQASRPLVAGTVARGQLRHDTKFYTGKSGDIAVSEFPRPVTTEGIRRGQQRYNIFCSQCHDRLGNGQGMVVRRGFPRPPTYHTERLRNAPVGHLFDVISNGFGRMPGHRQQIPPGDRWAIVAYVRALQLSQHAPQEMLTPEDLTQLAQAGGQPATHSEAVAPEPETATTE